MTYVILFLLRGTQNHTPKKSLSFNFSDKLDQALHLIKFEKISTIGLKDLAIQILHFLHACIGQIGKFQKYRYRGIYDNIL